MFDRKLMDDHCYHHAPVNTVIKIFDRKRCDCLIGNYIYINAKISPCQSFLPYSTLFQIFCYIYGIMICVLTWYPTTFYGYIGNLLYTYTLGIIEAFSIKIHYQLYINTFFCKKLNNFPFC